MKKANASFDVVEDLPERIDELQHDDFDEIQEKAFGKYDDDDYIRPSFDVVDDLRQTGAIGTAITKTDKITGKKQIVAHMIGYTLDQDFDADDFKNKEFDWYSNKDERNKIERFIKEDAIPHKEVLYISEFAALEEAPRFAVFSMGKKFIKKAREKGYKYIAAQALSDSYRLFMNGDTPRTTLLRMFGLRMIAKLETDDGIMVVLGIK